MDTASSADLARSHAAGTQARSPASVAGAQSRRRERRPGARGASAPPPPTRGLMRRRPRPSPGDYARRSSMTAHASRCDSWLRVAGRTPHTASTYSTSSVMQDACRRLVVDGLPRARMTVARSSVDVVGRVATRTPEAADSAASRGARLARTSTADGSRRSRAGATASQSNLSARLAPADRARCRSSRVRARAPTARRAGSRYRPTTQRHDLHPLHRPQVARDGAPHQRPTATHVAADSSVSVGGARRTRRDAVGARGSSRHAKSRLTTDSMTVTLAGAGGRLAHRGLGTVAARRSSRTHCWWRRECRERRRGRAPRAYEALAVLTTTIEARGPAISPASRGAGRRPPRPPRRRPARRARS